ncbi:amylo-alpha-1,6-glucosidase [Streptomyces sp. NPDC001933]|uniref:amylo-alpha-1,6-glucosidase n=1 Tax=Streptomyces sp. NPDC001933 TaxID=3364626 RepID=UPI0036860590
MRSRLALDGRRRSSSHALDQGFRMVARRTTGVSSARAGAGPIALCEVQAYTHEAAVAGAALLDVFDRPGADRYRVWAARLQEAFRRSFWVSDEHGRYPAIALDEDRRLVDAVTSNLGHLLGTGLLNLQEEAAVADRLLIPGLADAFGLRTHATSNGGYNPLGYHIGSVWPHDTAIAVQGLARAGFPDHARRLAENLIAVGPAYDSRLPELFAGTARSASALPAPYPASCRPPGMGRRVVRRPAPGPPRPPGGRPCQSPDHQPGHERDCKSFGATPDHGGCIDDQ